MTYRFIALLMFMTAAAHGPAAGAGAPPSFIALAYHNVEDQDPDQKFVGVTTERLIAQLSWLQGNGYHPVTIDELWGMSLAVLKFA